MTSAINLSPSEFLSGCVDLKTDDKAVISDSLTEARKKGPDGLFLQVGAKNARRTEFSSHGLVWVIIGGCPCHRCVKENLEFIADRVVLDGFILLSRAGEVDEGVEVHSDVHDGKVRCGVLRAVESNQRIVESYGRWNPTEDGSVQAWRRCR